MYSNCFEKRHNGPRDEQITAMLDVIGVKSLDELIDKTIPPAIRLKKDIELEDCMSESDYLKSIKKIASENKIYRSFIGAGYYQSITPNVILRNILENPGWYTAYTPYQAEISQGRLEALLVFQTMISDLCGLPIANSSLLDEATAAAEALTMFFNNRSRDAVKKGVSKLFVADNIFPHTKDVLITRAEPLGIELVFANPDTMQLDDSFFGAILQKTDNFGELNDYSSFTAKAKAAGVPVAVGVDLLSLALVTPPGEYGADCVFGSSQRFGIPLGFGGPHAAFFATSDTYKRQIPGRIIGQTIDAQFGNALRMALQTREQHIKREKATSNICTAQALLAIMSAMYAVYHGKDGIYNIAKSVHEKACSLTKALTHLGYAQNNKAFFDTLNIGLPAGITAGKIEEAALAEKINFRYFGNNTIGISLDEATQLSDLELIAKIFAKVAGKELPSAILHTNPGVCIPQALQRKTSYLEYEVFNTYHSETEMMRYLKKLENKDLALNRTMIPLGSCTMKLNAVAELMPITWPEFSDIHPFAPEDQWKGYRKMIDSLEKDLCQITGFDAISFQPNSGAAGEYAGLMVIRAYLKSIGQGKRNVCIIPSSAHGTNPASAVMAGMKVVVTKCDENGNIDLVNLRKKATEHKDDLAAVMITYPSTHGVFEENILDITKLIHDFGGQVYMDGANMNAQVGYTHPYFLGADVCHLNLHKTFAIPHGGGGPGVGPIGVAAHLTPFLPTHSSLKNADSSAIPAVASAAFGSAMVLPISYGYIKMMGGKGLKKATALAICNANYLRVKLEKEYKILYVGKNGMVAHEMIVDCNEFKRTADIDVIDIAKRLMDYGFHAPTVAFPVHGTLMVEPTESEPISELDRFVEAMLAIRAEIREIEEGKADKANNVLKNSPHTVKLAASSKWPYAYSREKAVFPVASLKDDKYWPPVARVNDGHGDRNLICTCGEPEDYQ